MNPLEMTNFNPFSNKPLVFTGLQYKSFENTVGKGEFSPFPTGFSTHFGSFLPLSSNLKLSSAYSFTLKESKICCLGKG